MEKKSQDVQSMIYIAECTWLERKRDFESVIRLFEDTEAKISSIEDVSDWRVAKNVHLTFLRVKLGNCYFPGCNHQPYAEHENLALAEYHYLRALNEGVRHYLVLFSLAQALCLKSTRDIPEGERRQAREEARKLFKEAFEIVKVKVGGVSEPKIRMTMHYILAICVVQGEIDGTTPETWTREIYSEGWKIPWDDFRIFSPLTKNDLNHRDFLAELKAFERGEVLPAHKITEVYNG